MDIFLWIAAKFWRAITHFIKKLSTGQRKGQADEKGKP
jgi:membrane glycosyltransferase